MSGAHAAEVPALHRTGETFTNCVAGNVDLLAWHEVVSQNFSANLRQIARNAEFLQLGFRRHAGFRELAAQGLVRALGFLFASTKDDSLVAVSAGDFATLLGCDRALVFGAHANDLAAVKRQNRHGNVAAVFVKDTCHAQLAGQHAGTGGWKSH